MSIQVSLISRMNFNYEGNGGNKSFLAKPKHQYHVSQYGEYDCSSNKKNYGDYCEYPSLPHFMDGH